MKTYLTITVIALTLNLGGCAAMSAHDTPLEPNRTIIVENTPPLIETHDAMYNAMRDHLIKSSMAQDAYVNYTMSYLGDCAKQLAKLSSSYSKGSIASATLMYKGECDPLEGDDRWQRQHGITDVK